MKSKQATYVGGSLDGRLVAPSTVRACIKRNLPLIHSVPIFNADYPMAMHEYYTPEENDKGVIFRLTKTEHTEVSR